MNGQDATGLALKVPFFTMLIFMCRLLCRAGDVMCQRHERRFETPLVTCRPVHVAKLRVRGHEASPRAHGDIRAVSTVFPGIEMVEFVAHLLAPGVGAIV